MNKTTSILVVDDDPAILQTYSEILRAEGYEVWEAATGQQGLQAARERRPNLVLLDVMLPDLSGIEVCRQIKADAALTDVFVVLVSGKATSVAHKVDGLGTGADDYLVRPMDVDEFLARVRTILRLRNAMAALRASAQRHRQLVEILPEAVGLIDLQGRLLAVNSHGAEMLGYADPGELLERSVFDLTRPEYHERIRTNINTTLKTGILRNAEYLLLRKSGDLFPAEVSTAVAADADGQPSGIVLVARETTERKRVEEALQGHARILANNARFLQTLIEAIPAPLFYKDADARYLGCNKAFEQYLGFSQEQIIGKTVYDVAPKDLAEVYHQADQELLERPGAQTYESSVVYADGTRHQVVFNKATFQNTGGEIAGLIGFMLDITERKRAEEQIQLLADAVQSTQDMITITDQENRFTFANRAFLQTYGYTAEEIMGKTPGFLFSAKNPPGLSDVVFQQTLRGGWKGEIVNRRKDGTEFPISLNTSLIRSSEGRTLGLVGVARDISERMRAEKRSAAFAQLGYRLSAASATEQAANVILEIGSELFGWDAGYVTLYSATQDQITALLTVDTVEGEWVRFPPTSWPLNPSPMMRRVIKEGAQLLNPTSESVLTPNLVRFGNVDRHAASMMFVPIHARGAVIGILCIQSYTPQAYCQEDLKLLQTLADHCGDTLRRMEMEDSLLQAEAKYRAIFENAAEGLYQTTPEGRHLSANPALARMLGYATPEELMSSVTDIERQLYVNPERRRELKWLIEKEGSVKAFEAELYRKDGSKIWASINAHAVRDASGAILYYEGINQDITERKRMAETLQETQERFRAVFENCPDGIVIAGSETRKFLVCNAAFAQMVGYAPDEVKALSVEHIHPAEALPHALAQFEKLARMEIQHTSNILMKRKDTTVFHADISAFPITLAGKVYVAGFFRDITERKQTEEALEKSQRLQKAILDNIRDPAWLKDTKGRFLGCNLAVGRFWGYTSEEIVGKTVFDLSPQYARQLRSQDQKVVNSRRTIIVEENLTDAQGQPRWFETINSPICGDSGQVTGTVGIARDITARRWFENLLRLQRDFGIFLSSTDDLGATAKRLLKIALENEGLDCGAVYLVNSQTNTLELTAHQGLSVRFAKRSSRFAADRVRDRSAGARPATFRKQVGPMAGIVRQLKREGLLTLEVIPIQHSGEVVAVLNVGSRAHASIPANTRKAIEALAAQAGGAIARIRAEQLMRTSRQMLEKTIHCLQAAVFMIDAHTTTIQECNPAATRIFGYSREEIIGQSPALLHLNETMSEEFTRYLQAAVKEKGLLNEFEFMMKRKDGTSFPSEHTLVPIRNDEGQIGTWVGMVRDITERKRIEEDLRRLPGRIIEAQEAERQRVARELHDSVNQVIASAKMRLRKVEAFVVLNPVAKELLARCDELLVQALDENRRIAHDLRPTDLDALGLADACRNFCQQFQARTNLVVKSRLARFVRRCPPATELNLFRIVQEALNNVEKHACAKTVRLQITCQRRGLMLRIQDDGRGFDPKAVKAAGRKRGGIGLTNIRERTAILGGTCELVSAPNQGTAITVRVPCQDH